MSINLNLTADTSEIDVEFYEEYRHIPSHYGAMVTDEMKKLIQKDFNLIRVDVVAGNMDILSDDFDDEDEEENNIEERTSVKQLALGTYRHPTRRIYANVRKNYMDCYFAIAELDYIEELRKLEQAVTKPEDAKVYLLCNNNGYYMKESQLIIKDFDVEKSYGASFMPFYNNLVDKLNNKTAGVALLHGTPGSGKTSLIKYLTSVVNRKFVIIPNHLITELSSPYMIPFLIDHPELILILEDAEAAVLSRQNGNMGPVAELLNLSDGLIGAAIKCSLIVTFNTDISKIDPALQRKGRLLGEYKFDQLSIADSNILLEFLGKEYRTTKPMLLTDIYNIDEELFLEKNKIKNSIGFK